MAYSVETETDSYDTTRIRVIETREEHRRDMRGEDGIAVLRIERFKVEVWRPREWDDFTLAFPVVGEPKINWQSIGDVEPILAAMVADAIKLAFDISMEMVRDRASAIGDARRQLLPGRVS